MGKRFHIDINGVPAECKAKKKPCPRGGGHFGSIQEAQKRADYINSFEPKFDGDKPLMFKDRPEPMVKDDNIYLTEEEMEKEYPRESCQYRGGAYWAGKRAKENLDNKEIAKEVKSELKELYKDCPELKFSAKSDSYSVKITVEGLGWRDLYDFDKSVEDMPGNGRNRSQTRNNLNKNVTKCLDQFQSNFSNSMYDYSDRAFSEDVEILSPYQVAFRKRCATQDKLNKAIEKGDKAKAEELYKEYEKDCYDERYQNHVSSLVSKKDKSFSWDSVKERVESLMSQDEYTGTEGIKEKIDRM